MEKYGEWISVSDRLPKPEGHEEYLVTIAHFEPTYHGKLVMASEYEARFDDAPPFWECEADRDGTRVVAWMPMPRPYMSGEEAEGISVRECGLPLKVQNALCGRGLQTLQDIDGMTREELMKIRWIGKKYADDVLRTVEKFLGTGRKA